MSQYTRFWVNNLVSRLFQTQDIKFPWRFFKPENISHTNIHSVFCPILVTAVDMFFCLHSSRFKRIMLRIWKIEFLSWAPPWNITDLNIFNTFCDNWNGMEAMFHNQVGWWVFSFPVISCFRHFISCQDWVRSKCGEGYSRKSGVVGGFGNLRTGKGKVSQSL